MLLPCLLESLILIAVINIHMWMYGQDIHGMEMRCMETER